MTVSTQASPHRGEGSALPPRLLTVDDMRAELNIGRTLAYQLVESGALPVVRIGRAVRVRRVDLDAFLLASRCSRVIGDTESPEHGPLGRLHAPDNGLRWPTPIGRRPVKATDTGTRKDSMCRDRCPTDR